MRFPGRRKRDPADAPPRRFVAVCRVADLPVGAMRRLEEGDEEVVVYRTADGFFATDDVCSHMRMRLSLGRLEANLVICPLDGGTFDVRNGRPVVAPCNHALRVHPVKIEDETVYVGLASDG